MTDRHTRRTLVDLSVVTASAIILAVSYVLIARQHGLDASTPALPPSQTASTPSVVSPPAPFAPAPFTPATRRAPACPPVRGVRRAPRRPVRRVILRRRSRAS